jgi:hypothetical protein
MALGLGYLPLFLDRGANDAPKNQGRNGGEMMVQRVGIGVVPFVRTP